MRKYRFEAYTPPAKGQWGYYALPMLWADLVIGWANIDFKDGRLGADLGFVEGRPSGRDFDLALEAELDRMKVFLGGQEKAPRPERQGEKRGMPDRIRLPSDLTDAFTVPTANPKRY